MVMAKYKTINVKLSKVRQRNLLKLAKYLLGVKPEKFSMFEFFQNKNAYMNYGASPDPAVLVEEKYNDCGTVACAAGYGPAAGIKAEKFEDWWGYIERAFGATKNDYLWYYVFDASWKYTDNTPLGAAKRIAYVLQNGCVPNMKGYYLPLKNSYHKKPNLTKAAIMAMEI